MQKTPKKIVIDADCLNFLLNSYIGKRILSFSRIFLPFSIYFELGQRERNDLKKMNLEVIELGRKDKEFAGDIIWKIYQDKEYKISYLKNRKIHHTGECEGAAIARKKKCDFVLKEKRANSIIKNIFKNSQVSIINLSQFGEDVLKSNGLDNLIKDYLDEVLEEYS